jgi:hypothetical protein
MCQTDNGDKQNVSNWLTGKMKCIQLVYTDKNMTQMGLPGY